MIVRILTEGQYQLPSSFLDDLNDLDNKIVAVVAARDEKAFADLFASMVNLVRTHGRPLPAAQVAESDIVLPSPDLTIDEARELFKGAGIVPG